MSKHWHSFAFLPLFVYFCIGNRCCLLYTSGERVIVFHKDSYKPVEIKNDVVVALAKTNYLPNQAAPQFHVNPSSATQEQITKTDVLDKTVTMTKGVNAGRCV